MFRKLASILMISTLLLWNISIVGAADTGGGASPRWKAPCQTAADLEDLTSDGSVRVTLDTHSMWVFNAALGIWQINGGGSGVTYTVEDKIDNYLVQTSDLGVGHTLTMNNAILKTFTLPVLGAGDLGKQIVFVKKGAGTLVIQAGAGQTISDSSAAGTIYDDVPGETFATLTIEAISITQWIIIGADGSWTTT